MYTYAPRIQNNGLTLFSGALFSLHFFRWPIILLPGHSPHVCYLLTVQCTATPALLSLLVFPSTSIKISSTSLGPLHITLLLMLFILVPYFLHVYLSEVWPHTLCQTCALIQIHRTSTLVRSYPYRKTSSIGLLTIYFKGQNVHLAHNRSTNITILCSIMPSDACRA